MKNNIIQKTFLTLFLILGIIIGMLGLSYVRELFSYETFIEYTKNISLSFLIIAGITAIGFVLKKLRGDSTE